MTVIGRRNERRVRLEETSEFKLDLGSADLSDLLLEKANLSGANLKLADLSGTWLSGADLTNTTLGEVNLSRAAAWRSKCGGLSVVGN